MNKILVVDDELAMTRGLSRAILHRRPDYQVTTRQSGAEAIALLRETDFDLLITDLQMADGDGFELLAWLISQRPNVLAFAMSGFVDEEAKARLERLGSIECFAKPLDIDSLLTRLTESVSQRIHGHVDNVGLASFLQLVELERKTCTLAVRCDGKSGKLFLRRGELIDARAGELSGEQAACEIIGWLTVDLSIEGSCNNMQRTIWRPTYFLVMEAMRLRDEDSESQARASRPPADMAFEAYQERSSTELVPLAPTPSGRRGGSLHFPASALALLVIDRATGIVLASEVRGELDVVELARAATAVFEQEKLTITRATGDRDGLVELVFMTSSRGELLRPLPGADQFVLLVFDTDETNLVMARHELELFVRDFTAPAQA